MQSHIMRWIVPLIAGLIVVGLFIAWAMGQMKDLPIVHEGTGEKARFMRYLSCAAAMCGAWHQIDGDACHSGEVMSQPLEFEGQNMVKGCKELCEELRDDPLRNNGQIKEHYCGKDFAFNFTFKDKVNFTSLDIRNLYSFKNRVIHKSCYICPNKITMVPIIASLIPTGKQVYFLPPWGSYYSEGYLLRYTDDSCGERPSDHESAPGAIWLSSTVASKCSRPSSTDHVTSYSYCEFNKDDEVTIFGGPEPPHQEKYWQWDPGAWIPQLFTSCGYRADLFGTTYNCPQIFVC